jgi:hypothetical protein
MIHQTTREHGFGYVTLIIATAAVTSVVMIGLHMWQAGRSSGVSKELKEALANSNCSAEKDPHLCKFFVSTGAQKFSTVDFTDFSNGTNTSGSYETDNDAKYHVTVENGGHTYEVIGIGTTLYSKAASGKTWWRQQVRQSDLNKYDSAPGTSQVFTATNADGATITYQRQETAACPTVSNLTCRKYQVNDPSRAGEARFIWFDDSYYQLQRLKSIGNGHTVDATFGYQKTDIDAPSDSEQLPPNKYVVPGQSEPVVVPEGGVGPNIQDLFDD